MDETLERVRAGEDDPRVPRLRRDAEVGDDLVRREPRRRGPRARRSAPRRERDLFLALGTSLGVYPAAGLPEVALDERRPARDRQRAGDAVRPRRRRGARASSSATCSPRWSTV